MCGLDAPSRTHLCQASYLEGEVEDPSPADWLHHLGKALISDTQMEIKTCNTYWGMETQQLELQLAQHAQQEMWKTPYSGADNGK